MCDEVRRGVVATCIRSKGCGVCELRRMCEKQLGLGKFPFYMSEQDCPKQGGLGTD